MEATKQRMRWDGGGERVLYVEGMVGHGKSGEEEDDEEEV